MLESYKRLFRDSRHSHSGLAGPGGSHPLAHGILDSCTAYLRSLQLRPATRVSGANESGRNAPNLAARWSLEQEHVYISNMLYLAKQSLCENKSNPKHSRE